MQSLNVGAAWSWYGDPVRVDGPSDILRLDGADGSENLRKRAARMVHRLVGAALDYTPADKVAWDDAAPLLDSSFVVTDGARTFTVTLIEVGRGAQPLLMFLNDIPPRNSDLWVVHHTLGANRGNPTGRDAGGVICFTPGTRITTPDGPRLIEDLREGDLVQTKDSGAQPIEWVGSRPMTGARLFAMPHMRPIRIRAGALGVERPDESLLVSPEHRMLVQGDVAQALFNTSEVLVAAKDLINGRTITVDLQVPQTTYVHLMLPRNPVGQWGRDRKLPPRQHGPDHAGVGGPQAAAQPLPRSGLRPAHLWPLCAAQPVRIRSGHPAARGVRGRCPLSPRDIYRPKERLRRNPGCRHHRGCGQDAWP